MWRNHLHLRVAGPTILVSLLLLALCVAAGVYLYAQQASSATRLGEDVSSAHAAHNLEITLHDLMALLRERDEQVAPIEKRVRLRLDEAGDRADKEEEKRLVDQLESSWQRYRACWTEPRRQDEEAVKKAIRIIQQEMLPRCRELESFNAEQVQNSEDAHRHRVEWLVAGLVVSGTVGALAGLLLGYAVARGLRHTLHQLSIRIRDAAGKLGQDLPPVVLSEDGDPGHLQAQMQRLVRDIERVVAGLQQRERDILRVEQMAAVGQLAAGVAHELRNPLTSIKMLVQASREEGSGLAADDLGIIEQEIRRMERTLQTFLDFARPPKPEFRRTDLGELVERTFALVGTRARKQRVALHFDHPTGPVPAEVDADQMVQLLVNLVLNALDAMPAGGTLDLELTPAGPGGQLELRVSDTGPGISPDVLPRLFQPFVSSKETGLGLGLVISRRIAETHGGTLTAENAPGGGACLTLRIPAGTGRNGGASGGVISANGAAAGDHGVPRTAET